MITEPSGMLGCDDFRTTRAWKVRHALEAVADAAMSYRAAVTIGLPHGAIERRLRLFVALDILEDARGTDAAFNPPHGKGTFWRVVGNPPDAVPTPACPTNLGFTEAFRATEAEDDDDGCPTRPEVTK